MTELERVSHEAMVFMRGKYRLDEVGDGRDELKFRQGKKTILTVYTREDRFDFMIIFGKAEREAFEARREEFSPWVREVYDGSKTYHDGKWMMFGVDSVERLEEIKPLILMKKRPNRKPPLEEKDFADGQRFAIHTDSYTADEITQAILHGKQG